MTRCLIAAFALLLVAACSSKNIIEQKTNEVTELQSTGAYDVVNLTASFKPPEGWEVNDETFKTWIVGWQNDYREEMRAECYKKLTFMDDAAKATGATVSCDIYEMDKGGFSGIGGNGYARAFVLIKNAKGKVIFEGKLEGTGGNSGFESATSQGRMKFAVLNLARQIADILENGA